MADDGEGPGYSDSCTCGGTDDCRRDIIIEGHHARDACVDPCLDWRVELGSHADRLERSWSFEAEIDGRCCGRRFSRVRKFNESRVAGSGKAESPVAEFMKMFHLESGTPSE
ncbi:hypothetical protein N6V40_16500 [Glutamicibacter sp. M10]|nr:hypothetical protein [Glutamicibacter sp. M10]UXN31866.1 hypothetical protein N6V40_16500 [Glutamicibacter sp. M10]